MTNTKPSLKASKQAIAKPSEAEIVLLDRDKITVAPLVEIANDYIGQGIKLQSTRIEFAEKFCALMSDTDASYETAKAYKNHIYETVAKARGVELISVSKPLNKAISEQVDAQKVKGGYANLDWLNSTNKSAVSMSKARAELQALSDSDIKQKVQACAKAENFSEASKYSKELERRAKVKALEIKRSESKAITAIKADIKAFISSADTEQLAAFVYTKNNIDAVLKLANQSK
jgi:stage V sporulation protein SpoVS